MLIFEILMTVSHFYTPIANSSFVTYNFPLHELEWGQGYLWSRTFWRMPYCKEAFYLKMILTSYLQQG